MQRRFKHCSHLASQARHAATSRYAQICRLVDAPDTGRVHAHALIWHSVFARLLGQLTQSEASLQRCLAVLDEPTLSRVDTRAERAFALLQLANLRDASYASLEEAQRLWEQSLALYVGLERPWEQSCVLLRVGETFRFCGDHDLARDYLSTCRAIREAVGDRRGLAEALNYEVQNAVELGATDEALNLAQRSHALYEELDDTAGRADSMGRLGLIQIWSGLYPEAQRTLAASCALYEDLGDPLTAAYNTIRLALATMGIGDLEGAWRLATQSIDRSRAVLGSDVPQALWIGGMVVLMRGDLGTAARLIEASVELSERMGALRQARSERSWLALTHWLQGKPTEAQAEHLALLRAAAELHDVVSLLYTLLGLVLIFAEQGAPERAHELYALVRQHPAAANNQAYTRFFGQRLEINERSVSTLP